jgi:hypothetical protein
LLEKNVGEGEVKMNLSEREQLIRNLPEGDFTRIADKKAEEISNDYCKDDYSYVYSNKTPAEIIEYLKDTRFTMTYGYALRRLVINKFKLSEEASIDEIAEILYKEFNDRKIPILNRGSRKPSRNDEINGIKSWLNREESDSHVDCKKFLQGISFALEMSDIQVSHFLRKELGEQDYNFRDVEEVIIFYCHYHGYGYDKYVELLGKYNLLPENKSNNEIKGDYSTLFSDNYSCYFSEDDSLLRFLRENKGEFIKVRQSTIKQFRTSWYKALEKAKELNTLNQSDAPIRDAGFYRTLCAHLPEYEGNKSTLFTTKGSSLKSIVSNPLNRQRVPKLLGETKGETSEYIYGSARKSVTKKDLLTLEFYIFCVDREIRILNNEKIDYLKDYKRFISETDIMLFENGFFKLYPGNRFDNLVLISLMNTDCWDFWVEILEESFGIEEE